MDTGGADGRLRRDRRWAGLRPGDPVAVPDGPRGATFSFMAHVTNTVTGDEWVEVVGGTRGDRKVRAFRPDQVYPPGGSSSLADAPQLPFG